MIWMNDCYYRRKYPTFADVFPNFETFEAAYNELGIPKRLLTGTQYDKYGLRVIFSLLAQRYWQNEIAVDSCDMFKLKVMTRIFEHGPKWQRDMYLFDRLRDLSDDQLSIGTKTVNNHAAHPDSAPVTDSIESLGFIDSQNVTTYLKNPVERIMQVIGAEDSEITSVFVEHFSDLFIDFI